MNWLQNLIQPQQGGNMLQQAGQVSPQPGFMQRFDNFRTGNRGQTIGDMMAGWAMGSTPQQSLGMGAAMAREGSQSRREQQQSEQQRNQTVEWLQSQGLDPNQAALVAQNPQTLQQFLTDKLLPKDPEYGFTNVDGTLVRTSSTGEVQPMGQFGAPPTTDDIREYNFAVQQGYEGDFQTFMTEQRKAGATTVNVGDGSPGLGKLSTDYGYVLDPETGLPVVDPETGLPRAAAVPGSPAYQEQQAGQQARSAANEAALTASNTITTAAARAREAAANRNFGPAGTTTIANLPVVGPMTDSAEVVRQVDVLKSQAAFENLNAMRQQSPTGGALGSVTEKELKMLQDKSGALDPNSPTFVRDLADYEQTLLRIIHGKEAGDAIFKATRTDSGGDDIDALVDRYAN